MASLRSMRLRMRSIKNIGQVTKALEAVSASRVRKSQQAMFATRAYAAKAFNILSHLSQQPGNLTALHPLLHQHDKIESVTVVLFTSDRGLCGAYNTNALRTAMAFAKDQTAPVKFVAVGRKGRDLLLRRRFSVSAEFTNLPAYPTYADVSAIGRLLLDDYREGRADKVYLCYTRFVNALRQEPTIQQLLPLDPSTAGEAASVHGRRGSRRGGEPRDPGRLQLRAGPRGAVERHRPAVRAAAGLPGAARVAGQRALGPHGREPAWPRCAAPPTTQKICWASYSSATTRPASCRSRATSSTSLAVWKHSLSLSSRAVG